MSNIIQVVNELENLFPLKPATKEDINRIEKELSLSLADEYKEYLLQFGAILADGVELTGVAKSKERDVIQVTQREWEINPNVSHSMYVIENIGIEGIIIWQDKSGKVYESRPNHSPVEIANSLAEYLETK